MIQGQLPFPDLKPIRKKPVFHETKLCRKFIKVVKDLEAYNLFKGEYVLAKFNNENPNEKERIKAALMGTVSGMPDYAFYARGYCCFLEFKVNKDKDNGTNKTYATKEQIELHKKLENMGYVTHICRSIHDGLKPFWVAGILPERIWNQYR